jgi:FixJ family two-component response regulator
MPGLDGRALVEQLRVHEPSLKALYLTGHGNRVLRDMQDRGADAPIITKPFTAVQLAAAVRRVLDSKRAAEPDRKVNGGKANGGKANGGAR